MSYSHTEIFYEPYFLADKYILSGIQDYLAVHIAIIDLGRGHLLNNGILQNGISISVQAQKLVD